MADTGGVSAGVVVTVAVLGATATLAASAIAVLGHWLADRRLRQQDLARARRDAYANYLALVQRTINADRTFVRLLDSSRELREAEREHGFGRSGASPVRQQLTEELLEMRDRTNRLEDEGATALYTVMLLAGPQVRETLVSPHPEAAGEDGLAATDLELADLAETARVVRERADREASQIQKVEEAMRRELGA